MTGSVSSRCGEAPAHIRPAAVAGSFYPADPRRLAGMIDEQLDYARQALARRAARRADLRSASGGAPVNPSRGPDATPDDDSGAIAATGSAGDPSIGSVGSPAHGSGGVRAAAHATPDADASAHTMPGASAAARDRASDPAAPPLRSHRRPWPKAIIVPHAGYVYSGTAAALAYALLERGRGTVRRAVIVGPTHRVAVRGVACCSADAFATPLGVVPIDTASERRALGLTAGDARDCDVPARTSGTSGGLAPDSPDSPDSPNGPGIPDAPANHAPRLRSGMTAAPGAPAPALIVNDPTHAREHAVEVQIPFLQRVLGDGIEIVPLNAGLAAPEQVGDVLRALWGGPETVVVISSDLSHYHPECIARELDDETIRRVTALDYPIDPDLACGAYPINGLLDVLARPSRMPAGAGRADGASGDDGAPPAAPRWDIEFLGCATSGDGGEVALAGEERPAMDDPYARVVGYAAWAVWQYDDDAAGAPRDGAACGACCGDDEVVPPRDSGVPAPGLGDAGAARGEVLLDLADAALREYLGIAPEPGRVAPCAADATPARGAVDASVPAGNSTDASVPVGDGSTGASVPAGGGSVGASSPACGSVGVTPACGSANAPSPACGSADAPTSACGSADAPVPVAAGSAGASSPAHGFVSASTPAGDSATPPSPDPASAHASVVTVRGILESHPWLDEPGASFVTLTKHGSLRGCIGTLEAYRPLGRDVAGHAVDAAVRDPRFWPVTADEYPELDIEVSVLSEPEPMPVADRAGLERMLRPGVDGLVLADRGGRHRATFLPQVWDELPEPHDFVAHLLAKAGLPASYDWRGGAMDCRRYTVTAYRR